MAKKFLNMDDFIKSSVGGEQKLLPLTHFPKYKDVITVTKSQSLNPAMRNTYLFYARPSYCIKRHDEPMRRTCFLFRFDQKIEVAKCYPFDSGGFKYRKFKPIEFQKRPLKSYEISGGMNGVADFIDKFYGTNRNYFYANPIINLKSFEDDCIVNIYSEFLLSEKFGGKLEDYPGDIDVISHSLEIQSGSSVDFSNNLVAILCPGRDFSQFSNLRRLSMTFNVPIWRYDQPNSKIIKLEQRNIFSCISAKYNELMPDEFK